MGDPGDGQENSMRDFVRGQDLMRRYAHNPLITGRHVPFPCNTVFNAGATMLNDEFVLLLRVESQAGPSWFMVARSDNGIDFEVEERPFMMPAEEGKFATYERNGVEDARITHLEGWYYITYTAASDYGARIALARTKDFKSVERVGIVSEPDNKDAALFPKKFNGRYARLDRPMAGESGHMWISFSHDLIHWGDYQVLVEMRDGAWDTFRIGASAPPIETEDGWLEIYHGLKMTSYGPIYRLGAVFLELDDPTTVIGRTQNPLLSPREAYERMGDIPNVVYSCGAVRADGDEIWVYYSGADTCVCLGSVSVSEIKAACDLG
jgi:predicted GH43/DUF377 family glycosyl hydrolase